MEIDQIYDHEYILTKQIFERIEANAGSLTYLQIIGILEYIKQEFLNALVEVEEDE